MEDTAVINFLSNLTQLVISGHQVIAKEKDELLCLHNKIEYMSKFLKMTEEKRSQDQQVRRLVMQMRDTVFEAENIIDLFVVDAITVGDGGETDLSVKLEGIKKDIEAIEDRVKTMTNSNAEMTLVGFEEDVDRIIGKIEDGKRLQIISIVGMGGTGKTTLAEKLYQDIRTKGAFEIQAWVTVSQRHQAKDLLMDILESSSLLSYTHSRDCQSLGQQLYTKLKDKKFLIVIDNIWEVKTWKDIREYLPDQCNGSTVIGTSRRRYLFHEDAEMHRHLMMSEYLLELRPPEECWELLQIKVFGNQNSCPEELEMPGKIIAQQCHGVVLAIVVIGGLLAKKEKTSKWWNHVSKRIRRHGNDESPYTDVLELAYNCLPLHLKACFLYISLFPDDEEISVTNLTWMLVAEGFIIQDQIVEGKTVEDIAEGYINELVDRSLLTVSRKRSDGSTKACRIHDILRDFAIKKGEDESFLLHQQRIHRLSPADQNRHRRLSLDDKIYLEKLPIGNCRSLVFSSIEKDPETVFPDPTIVEEDAFRLLKVLDLLSISIDFPSNIGIWFHAKYLALMSEVKHLPQSFTNLFNLETLILYSRNTVILPHDIWKMVKLRHIYNKIGIFHFGTTAAGQTAQNISLENLQTLSPLCGCKTCVEMLVRAPKIRKLNLYGKFISKSGHLVFPDLEFLMQLKSLKLTNTTGRSRYTGEVITPKFSLSVRRLTLCNTLLKWEEISILGSLENLEVLKLLDNACVGSDWETSELEFPCLKYLKLKSVDLVKWVDHDMQFQNMQSLILEDCPNLEMLPTGLAQLSQLSLIEMKHCNKHVERLAGKIVQQHNKLFGEDKLKTVIIPKK